MVDLFGETNMILFIYLYFDYLVEVMFYRKMIFCFLVNLGEDGYNASRVAVPAIVDTGEGAG